MRALVSVSDKEGVVDFAKALRRLGWEVIATGGTMKLLRESGVEVINISDVTGFPEICDGRVKTLHPKVHGGLLARRDDASHMKALADNGIGLIDMVCVNLYPFRRTIAREGVTMAEAIENIDIGGPSMLRSAAKNCKDVTVVCDPADYDRIIAEIEAGGNTTEKTRLELSAKAYTHTAEYDACIATYMRAQAGLNEKLFMDYDLVQTLRYGENPHQNAKFYRQAEPMPYSLAFARQLNGKELSYNNIQDANAALNIVREFEEPFCVGLKHMNPCGAALGKDIHEAWTKAYEADKVSIFGGIVAVNRELDGATAEAMKPIFLEIIIAPSFSQEALDILTTKKNLRLLQVDMSRRDVKAMQYVSVNGGLLAQELDTSIVTVTDDMTVTKLHPTEAQLVDLNFAWRIVKHVKSNAIVVVKDGSTLGVGAGQMNRVGSAAIALEEARSKGATEGLVLASDGFFPFDDTVTLAAKYGIAAIVQPGGSVRDEESIRKADELGIAMVFTGMRHFKH
ncbi:MAG TPA: bifunctional phosphoribosylaminoimidazolecarboxamide formyltransferase/IMP cyclohydrolase [Candidatus Alistipes excrementipullorum]|nr:bifunctional phosphoribosylaminoimidazolecarboxamide formyltransferase/IMP cyclohydrolase [Candidatus Alistipes excrementipullorum]